MFVGTGNHSMPIEELIEFYNKSAKTYIFQKESNVWYINRVAKPLLMYNYIWIYSLSV